MAHGSAEGTEDCGKGLLYCVGDLVIGAAGVLGEWREGDVKGAGGQIGRGRPAIGDGEDDGALEEKLERLAVAGLAAGDADAAGEAAEGVGDLRGEGGDVVEGEDPVAERRKRSANTPLTLADTAPSLRKSTRRRTSSRYSTPVACRLPATARPAAGVHSPVPRTCPMPLRNCGTRKMRAMSVSATRAWY